MTRRDLGGLSGEANLGALGVEDGVLGLQEDVTEDGEAEARVALDTAVAGGAAGGDGGVVDDGAGHDGIVGADGDGEVGQGGGAVEDVAAILRALLSAGDLLVVGSDDIGGEHHEGGAGVGNTLDGGAGGAADLVAIRGEHPEALRAVDGLVGNGAGVLGAVDEAEVIGAGSVVLQAGGEDGLVKAGLDGVEEGGLGLGLDGVDGAEGEAEQTVVVLVLHELRADLLSGLHGLAGSLDTADGDGVLEDVAAGGAAVAVADRPAVAGHGRGVAGLVDGVTSLVGLGQLGREDPQVGRAGVKVQVHGCATDVDGSEVLLIVALGGGGNGAVLGRSLDAGGNGGTVLQQGILVHASQVDAPGAVDALRDLVDGEGLGVGLAVGDGRDGASQGQSGGDLAEDNHDDDSDF